MGKDEYISLLLDTKRKYEDELEYIECDIKENKSKSSKYTRYNVVLLTIMLMENFISSLEEDNITMRYLWDMIILQEFILVILNVYKHENVFSKVKTLKNSFEKYEEEINKMQKTLEFFKTTPENEIKKYISYKMN